MFRTKVFCLVLMLWGICILPFFASAQEIAVAGSPKSSIYDRNYKDLFLRLKANGISVYFPTFQFQEVPYPKSLGYETDFSAPCSHKSLAFQAMRETGMKIIIPAELLYPDPNIIGHIPLEQDPLIQIKACIGKPLIAAVTTYDEAAFHGISLEAVAKLYNHLKNIAPEIPVLMVHAPIITDKNEFRSEQKISTYLDKVNKYSEYADIVGFNIYPIPEMIAKIASPLSKGSVVSADRVIKEYMAWLDQFVSDRQKLVVLQGFSYTNLYEETFLNKNVPLSLRKKIRPPTYEEIDIMFKQALEANVEMVIFWGMASLKDTDSSPWPDILRLSKKHKP